MMGWSWISYASLHAYYACKCNVCKHLEDRQRRQKDCIIPGVAPLQETSPKSNPLSVSCRMDAVPFFSV